MSEVIATDTDRARRLTERIRRVAQNVAEQVEELRTLVAEAKESEAHVLLGYASWTAYLADLFGDEPLRLARDVRKELVAELHEQGMSTRAIAPIVGVDRKTVERDVRGGTDVPPASTQPTFGAMPAWAGLPATPATEGKPTITPKSAVVGLDGKTYPKPAVPQAPRRAPLVDSARSTGWELQKLAERLRRIRDDDRFGRNKAEIAAALRPHLDFAQEVLQDLDHALNEGTDA